MLEKREDGKIDVKGYGFLVGKIPYRLPRWFVPKGIRNAMRLLAETEGLVGIAPLGDCTLVVYNSLNEAKRARNMLVANGIEVFSKEIKPVEETAEGSVTKYI